MCIHISLLMYVCIYNLPYGKREFWESRSTWKSYLEAQPQWSFSFFAICTLSSNRCGKCNFSHLKWFPLARCLLHWIFGDVLEYGGVWQWNPSGIPCGYLSLQFAKLSQICHNQVYTNNHLLAENDAKAWGGEASVIFSPLSHWI